MTPKIPNGQPDWMDVWWEFGPRRPIKTPNGWTSSFHNGIDIGPRGGTIMVAAVDGRVTRSAFDATFGNRVEITELTTGHVFRYAHFSVRDVRLGENVTAGQRVGVMGETGKASGRHLHFEVLVNGKAVNPRTYYADRHARPAGGGGVPDPFESEEDEEMKPKLIHRNEGRDEWSLVHPDYRGPGEHERGYLVTTDEGRAIAWARLHGNGWATKLTGAGGRYTADVDRDGYIAIQEAARAEYDAKNGPALTVVG